MNHHEQRRLGVKFATEAGASKTKRTITEGACFEAIFTLAANEIGRDALVSFILQGDPEWAYNALLHVPELSDAQRDALLEQAAGTPEAALQTLRFVPDLGRHRDALSASAGASAAPLGSISQLSLINDGGFVCEFTMYWTDGGVTQPAGTSGSPVVWSREMDINFNPVVKKCSDFAASPSKAPLKAGDEVWMYVWVAGGKDNQSALRFTYDPTSAATANFVITGGVDNNELGFTGITTPQAPAPPSGLGSNSNYILADNCEDLKGLSVTIDVSASIVCKSASGPKTGFGFQLNCYSPQNEASAWQQYVIAVFGSEIIGAVDNWPVKGENLINHFFTLAPTPNNELPTGYKVTISLQSDASNRITGATYVVIDNAGNTLANMPLVLMSIPGVTEADLAPIVAFELNLVGPVNSESAVLSSGVGTITYTATNALTALGLEPSCTESGYITAETANSVYGTLPAGAATVYTQQFSTAPAAEMIHKTGLVRPSTRR